MSRTGPRPLPPIDRFLTKITAGSEPDSCWEWTAAKYKNGYGRFYPGGHRVVGTQLAHRWAYEHYVGSIPEGLDLDHLCRNRACVNPDHLEPVTRQVNLLRGATSAAHNAAKTHCPQGHPYDEANTYSYRTGGRGCRACRAERNRVNNAQRRNKEYVY